MSNIKKLMMSAAGGGAGPNVEEVFSTYLYSAAGVAQTITNGIDLDGEGGLVWIKNRTGTDRHGLYDTARGVYQEISSNLTNSQRQVTQTLRAFNSDGFDVGTDSTVGDNGKDYASWTFRKAPKFFDVVTYTGTGSAQNISHDLGSVPGCIIIKNTSSVADWTVYHRGTDSTAPEDYNLALNKTDPKDDNAAYFNDTAPTESVFTVNSDSTTNTNGDTYVAYLFAHNDGDGEFGPDGDADIIKCGSYTGNGNDDGPEIDLGFEPQWVMVKNTTDADSWYIFDVMRGMVVAGTDDAALRADSSDQEYGTSGERAISPTPTGFKVTTNQGWINNNNTNIIYMAIRRGTKVPESATEVFEPAITYDESNDPGFNSGFVTDMFLWRQPQISDEFRFFSRLNEGASLRFDSSLGENNNAGQPFDFNDGVDAPTNDNARGWLWKRAPQFFDVVCYTGTGSVHNVSHNLGAVPEMMWVKRRDSTDMWKMYHSSVGNTKYIRMDGSFDGTNTPVTSSGTWNNTTPSDTTFTVGTTSDVNGSGRTFIACLFASLDGISKVGSYTGNGSSQTINCGFTAGARFVLIKNTSASNSNWFVFDTVRGIVSGNDNTLYLNSTASQVTNEDCIDPHSSGFIVTNSNGFVDTNNNNQNYIFYAIA